MKFELLYLLARIRGFFSEYHKGTFVYGKPDKKVDKEIYLCGFIPYRIDNLVLYR